MYICIYIYINIYTWEALTSWCRMAESLPPLESKGPFQASDDTRARWPENCRTILSVLTSHSWILCSDVPTAMYLKREDGFWTSVRRTLSN